MHDRTLVVIPHMRNAQAADFVVEYDGVDKVFTATFTSDALASTTGPSHHVLLHVYMPGQAGQVRLIRRVLGPSSGAVLFQRPASMLVFARPTIASRTRFLLALSVHLCLISFDVLYNC